MTYRPVSAPPRGWALGVLRRGDSLATLASELGLADHVIPTVNGVPWPGRKTYAWARDISAWVLATGGRREPVVPSQPNNAEPGLGFTSFAEGQVIYLPAGARPLPGRGTVPGPTPSPQPPKKKSKAGWIAAGLAAAAALAVTLTGGKG